MSDQVIVPLLQAPGSPHPLAMLGNANEAPARVQVALEMLRLFTVKTAPRAAVNDIAIEVIDGQKLKAHEENALSAACHCLMDYLKGSLALDALEAAQVRNSEVNKPDPPPQGRVSPCPLCAVVGQAVRGCSLCAGAGEVVISPNRR